MYSYQATAHFIITNYEKRKNIFRKFLLLFSNNEVKMFLAVHVTFLKFFILLTSKLRIEREGKKRFVQRRFQLLLLWCTLWAFDKWSVSMEQRQNAVDGGKKK
jgi:myosin-crossreactive antigen